MKEAHMSLTPNKLLRRVVRRSRLAYSCFERFTFHWHRNAIRRATEEGDLRLHLGCGPVLLAGWINVDASIDVARVTARLPEGLAFFASGSAQFIYASHMLEHIGYPVEATAFAAECHRILKPAGILRI